MPFIIPVKIHILQLVVIGDVFLNVCINVGITGSRDWVTLGRDKLVVDLDVAR